MEFFCPESVKNFISNLIILSITAATPFLFIQDKSGTLSSTDPTSYLEDRVILDKVEIKNSVPKFYSGL